MRRAAATSAEIHHQMLPVVFDLNCEGSRAVRLVARVAGADVYADASLKEGGHGRVQHWRETPSITAVKKFSRFALHVLGNV